MRSKTTLMQIGRAPIPQHDFRKVINQLAVLKTSRKWKEAIKKSLELAEMFDGVADVHPTQKYAREALKLLERIPDPPVHADRKKAAKLASEKAGWLLT